MPRLIQFRFENVVNINSRLRFKNFIGMLTCFLSKITWIDRFEQSEVAFLKSLTKGIISGTTSSHILDWRILEVLSLPEILNLLTVKVKCYTTDNVICTFVFLIVILFAISLHGIKFWVKNQFLHLKQLYVSLKCFWTQELIPSHSSLKQITCESKYFIVSPLLSYHC